ncbi:MAG: efflux RND transporter permease subunit [Clostridia bacterium]|nr:efflux RND transporter permease subunit [Clostridia bacterium]
MKLSNLAVRRPVTIAMIFLVVILLGVVSVSKLNLDLLPELDLPMALAMTSYDNVSPEEMEELVTRPIESALGTVSGIKNINSTSSEGSSIVFVEFSWGTDMNFAVTQMREKIDFATLFLPQNVGKTTLLKLDPNMMPIMVIGFGGNYDLNTLNNLANDVIKPHLERIEGVASVDVMGGIEREIRISAIPQRLQAYGLSLNSIISYLGMENRNTSVGAVEEGLKKQVIRVTGEFNSIQEIEDLQIPLASGGYIRLADIATVEDTFKESKQLVYMNGVPSVQISVQRSTDANTVKVSDEVIKELENIKGSLPAEIQINVGFDQAEFIRLAISKVKENVIIGAVLAVLILFLFLRNIRSTLIIGTAIPISIIATFILMYFGGLTLNLISLGGLALGVGMMVDNAIVILENIYRHRKEGLSRIEAAKKGANEVSMAVVASTLTSIVVFLPIVYVEGIASQIFRPMALTVSFALVSSLMVALTLVPMLSSKILKVEQDDGKEKKRVWIVSKLIDSWGKVLDGLDRKYRVLLRWSIDNKIKIVVFTLLMVIASVALIPKVGMEFIPSQDSGEYNINISLPNGTALRETQRVTELVEKYIQELPENEWSIYAVGSEGGNMLGTGSNSEKATISGKLIAKDRREHSPDQVLDELRTKCVGIAGADIEIKAQDSSMGSSESAIDIGLTGDNLDVLTLLSETIAKRVKKVEGTREIVTSIKDGRPEVHLVLNREKADQYGINSSQLASLLGTAINGTTATHFRDNGEEVDVSVALDKRFSKNINDLESITIVAPTGAVISVRDIAKIEKKIGPTKIERLNQTRRVSVTGDISGRDLGSVTKDIQAVVGEIPIPPGIQIEFGGANKEMMDSFYDLGLALMLAIVLVYMILAAQFEALLYPFVIMFSIPPTIIGVVVSLFLTGRTLSVPTFIGIIMLSGIVVNNAIVMVDYINTLRNRDGMERREAILKAGPTRLRPILMTSLTTILALLPSTLGLGEGSELSAPMATAVAGGLTVSTLTTLLLIPCMYIMMDNLSIKIKRLFGKGKDKSAENIEI